MPSTDLKRRLRERAAQGVKCDVAGCYAAVDNISRYCKTHRAQDSRTGHPNGQTIKKAWLEPFETETRLFIEDHKNHRGIDLALTWIERVINEADPPEIIHNKTSPAKRTARWLQRMKAEGTYPEEVLARVVGMYSLRQFRPDLFRSDRHFNHQLAIRVLRLVPARHRQIHAGGKSGRRYDYVTVGVRDYLSQRLKTALGVLSHHILEEIEEKRKRAVRPNPDLLDRDAVLEPFTQTPVN